LLSKAAELTLTEGIQMFYTLLGDIIANLGGFMCIYAKNTGVHVYNLLSNPYRGQPAALTKPENHT
jgi:hypothetical protein